MRLFKSLSRTTKQQADRLTRTLLASITLLALISTIVSLPATAAESKDRAVETINVSLGADGTINDIQTTYTNISLTPNQSDISTTKESYSPAIDAKRLPVRISTSYTTTEKSGSNLTDLRQANGRIRIDLQIHNLTVKPETITVDANGQSLKRRELIGTPLTVVASTTLPGAPAQVVTSEIPEIGATTNGVVSQDAEGNTIIQWATVLAPPAFQASGHFSLVVDANNFAVPSFAISVQPGIIADASSTRLFEDALHPENTPEARLTADTINVLTQARDVFTESGKTLNDVRELLENSANTIGVRTISDLQASNSRIQGSAKGLSSTLKSLDSALHAEINATDSTLSHGLNITTNKVRTLLGNIEQAPPTLLAEVDHATCEVKLKNDSDYQPQGVYGMLLNLNATMDAYAKASNECHAKVVASLLEELGPETPDTQSCQSAPNTMTCTLFTASESIRKSVNELKNNSQASLEQLRALPVLDLAGQLDSTKGSLGKLQELHEKLAAAPYLEGVRDAEDDISRTGSELGEIISEIEAADSAMNNLLNEITYTHDQLRSSTENGVNELQQAREDIKRAVKLICESTADDPFSEAHEIVSILTNSGCDATVEDYDNSEQAVYARINRAAEHFQNIDKQLPTSLDEHRALLVPTLERIRAVHERLSGEIDILKNSTDAQDITRQNELNDLATLLNGAEEQTAALSPYVSTLNQELGHVITDVEKQIARSEENVEAVATKAISEASAQARSASVAFGEDSSARISATLLALVVTSNAIRENGKIALGEAMQQTDTENKALSAELTAKLGTSARAVSQRVDAAVKDSDAAATLLQEDINRVLADIGENKDKGTGLLGTVATSNAQLKLADLQMARASINTENFTNTQRGSVNEQLMRSAQIRQSMVRLEKFKRFTTASRMDDSVGSVFNFHISGE